MVRDVKFYKEEGSFKLRVCGVIKCDNKYLIIRNNNEEFYGLPAGHIHLGENSLDAVYREVKEETGLDVKVEKLLATIELFFNREDNKPFHEIGYYYLMSLVDKKDAIDFQRDEDDQGEMKHHTLKWVSLDEFDKYDVHPSVIKEILETGVEGQNIIINKIKVI